MNKHAAGFTLIEITIALLISSMLTLLLYQSFSQAQRSARNSSSVLDAVVMMPIVYNQLEKDFSTIFVPERVFKDLEEKSKKKDGSPQAGMQAAPQVNGADTDKKKKEPFKDIFVGAVKEKKLELMSFISTHSLALYDTVVPHAVRVVYRLVPLIDNPTLFSLVRQETTKLDMPLAKFKEDKVREYDLMRGVKDFKVEFLVPEKEKESDFAKAEFILSKVEGTDRESDIGKEQKKEKKPKTPPKYITLETWAAEGAEGDKKTEYLIPAYINVSGVFVDPITERDYPFEWKFSVPVFDDVALRVKKAQAKKQDKAAQPGQPKPATAQPGSTQQGGVQTVTLANIVPGGGAPAAPGGGKK